MFGCFSKSKLSSFLPSCIELGAFLVCSLNSLQGRWYLLRPRTSTKVVIKLTLEVKVIPCQVFVTLFEVLLVVLWSRPAAKDTSVTWSASSPASVILISRSREITSVIALRSLKNCFCPKLEPISHLNAKIQKRGRQQNCV